MSQTVLNKCKYSDRNKEGELEVTEKVFQREKYMDWKLGVRPKNYVIVCIMPLPWEKACMQLPFTQYVSN